MLGGRLTPERVLEAYRRGIFPWPIVESGYELLAWFSPDPRAIIELDQTARIASPGASPAQWTVSRHL